MSTISRNAGLSGRGAARCDNGTDMDLVDLIYTISISSIQAHQSVCIYRGPRCHSLHPTEGSTQLPRGALRLLLPTQSGCGAGAWTALLPSFSQGRSSLGAPRGDSLHHQLYLPVLLRNHPVLLLQCLRHPFVQILQHWRGEGIV